MPYLSSAKACSITTGPGTRPHVSTFTGFDHGHQCRLDIHRCPWGGGNEFDNARFAHHSNKRFADWDFASCSLPRIVWPDQPDPRPADLVHARHVLQHMPIARAAEAAYHLVASGARVVVVSGDYRKSTSGARRGNQLKMREGEMGEKDMAVAPFFFPPPAACNSNRMCAYAFDAASRAMWMARYEKDHRREANASTTRSEIRRRGFRPIRK